MGLIGSDDDIIFSTKPEIYDNFQVFGGGNLNVICIEEAIC